MAQKVAKKKSARRFTLFKETKIIIAIIFMIGFAGIGVKQLTDSHAASAIPATYYSTYTYHNCTPLCHTTGLWRGDTVEIINGTQTSVYIWGWPNGSLSNAANYTDQTTHYLQYGPYTSVYIPSGAHGLRVCYFFASYGANNDGNGYLHLMANLNYTGLPASNNVFWYAGELQTHLPAYAPIMQHHCVYYPLKANITYTNVEYRLRVVSTTDKDALLDLWKTTVNYY